MTNVFQFSQFIILSCNLETLDSSFFVEWQIFYGVGRLVVFGHPNCAVFSLLYHFNYRLGYIFWPEILTKIKLFCTLKKLILQFRVPQIWKQSSCNLLILNVRFIVLISIVTFLIQMYFFYSEKNVNYY